MRSRYRVNAPRAAHFITSTVVEWLPIFSSPGCCDILVESLRFCREHKALQLHAWVILPTHFHAIVSAVDLSGVMADFKKFTARRIVERLADKQCGWLLNQLSYYRETHKTTAHQVWQEGFHPQAIVSDEMMLQKLDYLHHNPVRAGFVTSPEHWRYSSAHAWLPGANPLIDCDPWR
ncbi:MAG: transposase [Chthoniobacteraceae bacterium]|nr:transposase [Chthoniobacteraceae bacterium]